MSGSSLDLRSAKPYVGQRVNVTLADGSIRVNVKPVKAEQGRMLVFEDRWVPKVDVHDVRLIVPISPYAFLQEGSE